MRPTRTTSSRRARLALRGRPVGARVARASRATARTTTRRSARASRSGTRAPSASRRTTLRSRGRAGAPSTGSPGRRRTCAPRRRSTCAPTPTAYHVVVDARRRGARPEAGERLPPGAALGAGRSAAARLTTRRRLKPLRRSGSPDEDAGGAVPRARPATSRSSGSISRQRADGDRAARMEAAARTARATGIRRLAREDLRRRLLVGVAPRHDRDQRLRVRVLRVADDVPRRPLLDDPAEVHDRDPVGEVGRRREVVRDHQHAHPVPAQAVEQAEDPRPHRDVEHRDGLVGDQELRLEHERRRDRDALALAARELVRDSGR